MYEDLFIFLKKFSTLTNEEFSRLKESIIIREFQKKEILIKKGDTEQYLYFINKGLIHQYFYKGKEMVTTDLVGPGTITGSVSSFLSGKPSNYYLEAMEQTLVLAMSKQCLEELYNSDKKWQQVGRILITYFLLQQERQLIDNIRFSMRERFVNFAEASPELLKRVPQRRLASYLNIKPETFTRLKPLLAIKHKTASSSQTKKK